MRTAGCRLRRIEKRAFKINFNSLNPPLIFLAFVAGAVLGSFAGTRQIAASVAEHILPDGGSVYGADGFFALLYLCARYHLLVLLFGTSLLGVVMIPAACAIRGFVLSCTAVSIASVYPENGAMLVLVVLGLPSLLTVPSLFIIGSHSLSFSFRLVSLYDRRPAGPADGSAIPDFLLSAGALVLAAAVEKSLIPILVTMILS
jgi:hypothetical protein